MAGCDCGGDIGRGHEVWCRLTEPFGSFGVGVLLMAKGVDDVWHEAEVRAVHRDPHSWAVNYLVRYLSGERKVALSWWCNPLEVQTREAWALYGEYEVARRAVASAEWQAAWDAVEEDHG